MTSSRKRLFLFDILLGIILPFSLTLILLNPVILPKGIPFYGDEIFYCISFNSDYFNPYTRLFIWASGKGPNIQETIFSYIIPLTILLKCVAQEFAIKTFILIVASLPGILTYFALKMLAELFSLTLNEMETRVFAVTGALFMLLPFVNWGLVDVATSSAWPYALLPVMFTLLVKYLKNGSCKSLLLLGICSLFASVKPSYAYMLGIMGVLYLIVEIAYSYSIIFTFLKRVAVATLVLFLFNAFWLVPAIAGYTLGAGGIFQTYVTERLITLESLHFLSLWSLLDVIMVGERQYFFFWLHPQNYGFLNVTIPLLAATSILVLPRNRHAIFMALTLVVGVFLTKGAHEPFGYLYYFVAKSLPSAAGSILRAPCRSVPLVTFSYAFLIGLLIAKNYENVGSIKISKLILKSYIFRDTLVIGLAILVLAPVTYGTLIDLQSHTWLRYKPTYVPRAYHEINEWLSTQPDDFKVMWIPSGGAYIWKPYIITAFPDLLSSKPAVYFGKVYPNPLKSTENIGETLKVLGVKYVIYHGDSLDYSYEKILPDLMKQKDLKIVYRVNWTYVPEEIILPFIVFENKAYEGPIYIYGSTLNYSLNMPTPLNLQSSNAGSWSILNHKQVSPVKWEVAVNASKPFTLVFTEPYDKLWVAYVNEREIKPVSIMGLANGFPIEETGNLRIRLYYTLQSYYKAGMLISVLSFFVLVALVAISSLRKRKIANLQSSLSKRKLAD